MTNAQGVSPGPNPPQFDSLSTNTQLVTLGIGGNDIGFSEIVENCSSPTPTGHPCQDHYVVNGHDELSDRIDMTAPKVAAVLQGIHQRAPRAQIFVVAYLAILPESGPGCWPQLPITPDDVPYLRGIEKKLNAMLATQAGANGGKFVDAYTASIGHDACQIPGFRWVEPAVPASPACPVADTLHGPSRGWRGVLKGEWSAACSRYAQRRMADGPVPDRPAALLGRILRLQGHRRASTAREPRAGRLRVRVLLERLGADVGLDRSAIRRHRRRGAPGSSSAAARGAGRRDPG